MAETALGMATTLVRSALGVVSSAAREKMGLLLGVQDDIRFISDELKMMQAFLGAADRTHKNTGVLKAYLELIRDLAYDIEDCFEEFLVFIKHKSLMQQLLSLRARHRIAVQIRSLKQRVQEVTERNQRYNVGLTASASNDMTGDTELIRNLSPLYVEEAQLVGLDEPKKKLIALVTQREDNLMEAEISKAGPRMVSVVGMGGLGKTTLAKKVYDTKDLREKFEIHAWITVSQIFDRKELLKAMVQQLFGVDSFKRFLKVHQEKVMEIHHLTKYLQERLKEKRYFIVLDDVWTTEAWNLFKLGFPDNSKDGSCVVVTTRDVKLAEQFCTSSHIHQLKFLDKEIAKCLFLKKTQKRLDDIDKGDSTKGIVEKILNKCGGLPLAIVTIGGLLANMDTKQWDKLYDQLPSELSSNPSLEDLRRIVHLSYNHLPSHLKPCFLHLSLFPEDFEIERNHLVNRWVAEGFATHVGSRRTLEDIAESYFYELISRSMIQPSKLDVWGNVKTCRVHDIVHDIAVSISKQENHVFYVEEHTSATTTSEESIRHISWFAKGKLNRGTDFSCVRSITMFSEPLGPIASLCSSRFKMLRVLDLKNAGFPAEQQDIKNIGLLLHLKYLHFPCTYSRVYALPRSIGNLQALQTLDIRKSNLSTLPIEITKLHSLRRLCCTRGPVYTRTIKSKAKAYRDSALASSTSSKSSRILNDACNAATFYLDKALFRGWSNSSGIKLPKGVGSLKELQILEKVDIKRTSRKAIREIGELTQLRKLVVRGRGASMKKCNAFCEAAQKLSSLRSLSVGTKERGEEVGMMDLLVSFASPLPSLERLKLKGRLKEVPDWVGKCVNLVNVDLKYCELKESEALAQLPNLIQLGLYGCTFNAKKLVFRMDAFPKLRILYLKYNNLLREVTFEENASPNMEKIFIYDAELTSGINGIKHLPNIKEISLRLLELPKVDILREEVNTHPNHPLLQRKFLTTTPKPVNAEKFEVTVEAGENSQP